MIAFIKSRWQLGLLVLVVTAALALAWAASVTYQRQSSRGGAAPATSQSAPIQGNANFQLDPDSLTVSAEAIEALTPAEARIANAGIPFSTLPISPARPFFAPSADIETYARALDCMTAAIYYEAGAENAEGQAAVAQVVINRMRHPAYPKSVCGVVFQGNERATGCQFTFTCDGSVSRPPSPQPWARARAAAGAALSGAVSRRVGMATHYHTDWVRPYWASRLVKVDQIGSHIFYRWPEGWGLPAAFSGRYLGVEEVIPKMLALSSIRDTPLLDAQLALVPAIAPEVLPTTTSDAAKPLSSTLVPSAAAPVVRLPSEPAAPPARAIAPVTVNPLAPPADPGRREGQRRIPLPTGPAW